MIVIQHQNKKIKCQFRIIHQITCYKFKFQLKILFVFKIKTRCKWQQQSFNLHRVQKKKIE